MELGGGLMVYMILAVPVIVAGMVLHFKLKEWGKGRWNILPKCLSTWAVVCVGFLGFVSADGGRDMEKSWILAALLLFLLADGFLEIQFFLGMGVFGAGHLLLIIWILRQGAWSLISLPVWAVFLGLSLLLFQKELREGKNHPKIYLMILYPAILMGMAALAVVLPWKLGIDYLWAGVGAVLFAVSDLMVGKGFFHKLSRSMNYLALSLYYGGIFFLALMIWV